jgi:hypothetical protein
MSTTWLFRTLGPGITLQENGEDLEPRGTLNFAGNVTSSDDGETTTLTIGEDPEAQALAALAIDWSAGSVFTKTLATGGNTFTFANATSGRVIIVRLTGHASGSTVTWPAAVRWAGGTEPTQTSTGTDVYTFVHDGTDIYGSYVQNMS